jgi:hypothetical protein
MPIKRHLEPIEMRYLYLFPYTNTNQSLAQFSLRSPKGAPYFFEHDIDVRSFEIKTIMIKDVQVNLSIQIIDEQVWLYDCHYTITAPNENSVILQNHQIQEKIKDYIHNSLNLNPSTMFEEYTIVLVQETSLLPDQRIEKNRNLYAGLIRTFYDKTLDTSEITNILTTKIRYSEHDLVIIDWNGAVIVTDDGDYSSDIDLLKIGNYQLIRYRMIDKELEDQLNYLRETIGTKKKMASRNNKQILEQIIEQRLSMLLTFEKLDTSLLLIGDWYSSKFYGGIVDEFYIQTWRNMVQSKLDNLKSLHEMMSEHLTLSWRRLIDQITLIGWFVMMLGYFILFFIDVSKR